MGKSGGRKKKSTSNQSKVNSGNDQSSPPVNGGVNLDPSVFMKRANELKEEGNRRFQSKDYVAALQHYEDAIKLTPKTHPDRAVFHSNRAACLMQMKPIDYETVISECTLALQVQPQFIRALLRRARAFEAVGKFENAMQDVQLLLAADPNHGDAREIAARLAPRQEAQQDPSPAALGASAVRGAPIAGIGPCLPARPAPKKPASSASSLKSEKLYPIPPIENGHETKTQFPKVVLKPSVGSSKSNADANKDNPKEEENSSPVLPPVKAATIRYRPLKLVYDHDIRLAQIPVKCSLKVLRDVVSKRFPMSKSVLIKFKDSDGDLVTLTCSAELRLAESSVDNCDTDNGGSVGLLRLHIVEVSPEQEPPLQEDEEPEPPLVSDGNEQIPPSGVDTEAEAVDSEVPNRTTEESAPDEKKEVPENPESKEVEMDDWLFEFAQLFRTHVGIDPDAHIDLHELGMELCSEALEESVTKEEAQVLFDKAAMKFQEVAALAFFNWGNVHMCTARKRIPIDESAAKDVVESQLQTAYDWVREKYSLAKEKYGEALQVKPDFYEGLLALGQQQFEMAKLHWSYILAKKDDLSKWDPSETIGLFDSAEEKMKLATKMWEKLEEQRTKELNDPNAKKVDEQSIRRKKSGSTVDPSGAGKQEISPEEAAEQAALMRSQIHLFWGNMLFERSQIECKLGLPGWKKNLDDAVERFKLAGASETDISTVLKNHYSNEEAAGGEKKIASPTEADAEKGDN